MFHIRGAVLTIFLMGLHQSLAAQACNGMPDAPVVIAVSADNDSRLVVEGRLPLGPAFGELQFGRLTSTVDWTGFGSDASGNYVARTNTRHVGAGLGIGVDVIPSDRWSACLTGRGSYGWGGSAELEKFYTNAFGQTIGFAREKLDADVTTWETAGVASIGATFRDSDVAAMPRLGLSFAYGGLSFAGESDNYTSASIDVGSGLTYKRLMVLLTYFRVLSLEFSDSSLVPEPACCANGLRIGIGLVL